MASLYRRNNSNVWWVRFQHNGTRVQRSSGKSRKADALRFLARALEEERLRQEQGYLKVRFGVLCAEYIKLHLPILSPRTRISYHGHLRVLKAHFGEDCYIDGIRKAHVAAFVSELKKGGMKTPTIRGYLATLSSLFSFAERAGWVPQNPILRLDKRAIPEAQPRTRFLSRDEYRCLLAASPPHLHPLIEVAVETGMRLEELLSLKWEQVDLERREVRLVLTKSKRPRIVPLSDRAVAVLVAGRRDHRASTYVFINSATGERYRTIKRAFRTACRRARLEDVRFHDLRHTFASWAVQSGVDLYPLSRILGHSTIQMTIRYAHLSTKRLHEVIKTMATSTATRTSDLAVNVERAPSSFDPDLRQHRT
jgi:integrase/recombinase XerD